MIVFAFQKFKMAIKRKMYALTYLKKNWQTYGNVHRQSGLYAYLNNYQDPIKSTHISMWETEQPFEIYIENHLKQVFAHLYFTTKNVFIL